MCAQRVSHTQAHLSLPVFHASYSRLIGTRRNTALCVCMKLSLLIMSKVLLLFSQHEQQLNFPT